MQTPRTTSRQSGQPGAVAAQGDAHATLCEQPSGRSCLLLGLSAEGRLAQRLADMGFLAGLEVRVIRRAPLGDPLEVDLAGVRVCIRAEEARQVLVRSMEADEAGVRL